MAAAEAVTLQLKGLPLAYNKDMQETQEPAFAVEFVAPMLALVARFTAALRFNFERMRTAATTGYLNAMAAATYLVHKGVPFRTAHEKIGNAVRFALEKGVELDELTLRRTRASSATEFGEDFYRGRYAGGHARLPRCDRRNGAQTRAPGARATRASALPLFRHHRLRRPSMLVRKARLQDASQCLRPGELTLRRRHAVEARLSRRSARTFATSPSPNRTAECFSAAARCTSTGRICAEVRSIVVKPEAKGQGAGGRILGALIEEAEEHGIQSVCLFTRIPDFFFKYGFRTVEDKAELPDKIFKDCQICPRLHRCDEVAMVRGRIPRMSILGPRHEAQQLVRLGG